MAHVTQCPVCGNYTTEGIHQECEVATLSDLLRRMQEVFRQSPKMRHLLPKELRDEIEGGKFISLKEHEEEQDRQAQKALEKTLHDAARQQAMQKAGEEFDRVHKDPDPITFA